MDSWKSVVSLGKQDIGRLLPLETLDPLRRGDWLIHDTD